MKKSTPFFILSYLLIASSVVSAQSITIQGTDCTMVADAGLVYIQSSVGTNLMKLGGLDLAWEDPLTNGGTFEQISPNAIAIDYTIANDPAGEVAVHGVFTLTGNSVKINYTLTAPDHMVLGGTMAYRDNLAATGEVYFSDTNQRRHDYANGISIFESINGNSAWRDNWKQHVYLTNVGNDTYTCSTQFTVAPHIIKGSECTMTFDSGSGYLKDADGIDRLKLGGLDLMWEDPRTSGGTAQLISPNQIAVDFTVIDDSSGLVTVNGIYSLHNNTVTVDYTLSAPSSLSLGGTMIFRQALNSTANTYFTDTTQRRHDFATPMSVFETIVGNSTWKDSLKQHVYLTDIGNDTYTCTTQFTLAPHTLQGRDCAMYFDSGSVYIKDNDNIDRLILGGLDMVWETPRTYGGTYQLISPNQIAVDFTVIDDPTGLVSVYGIFKLDENTVTVDYMLMAPTPLSLGGTMAFRQALGSTGNTYFANTTQRRYDFATPISVFENINGNASWRDSWKQHVYLTDIGSDTYTCSTQFTVAPHTIVGTNLAMRSEDGNVYVQNAYGTDLMQLGGINIGWKPPIANGGTVELISPNQFGIQYDITNDVSGQVSVYGIYTCNDNTVDADFILTIPSGMSIGGTQIRRAAINKTGDALEKIGRWERDELGGVAYEVKSAYLRRFEFNQSVALFEHIQGNAGWQNNQTQSISFSDNGDGTYAAHTSYTVDNASRSSQAVAEHLNEQTATISFVNQYQPFNVWQSGQTPEVTIQLTSVQNQTLTGTLYVTAHDYDGNVRLNTQQAINLAAWQCFEKAYSIPLLHLPDIAFVEAKFMDDQTEICFTQTNVGVLHDYTFTDKQNSNFGISAYFDIPTQSDVHGLLQRMGIRWNRNGDTTLTSTQYDAVSCLHNNVTPSQWSNDPAAKNAYFQDMLTQCDNHQNPYWEFGNEWNMSTIHTGTHADTYVNDWLIPLTAQRAGHNVQLMSVGIAGADTTFLNAIASNGGWNMLDAIAMHPGRGNFTPDYAEGGWTYLGAINSFKTAINNHGYKPLWLTEVYACTYPNSGWKDSYRRAAENIILTYAYGVSENIAGVEFYQLHDSVWHDRGGINPNDSEYHYGILYRDGTLKPSLLAFCAIAQALDGATFNKYMTFTNPDIKGIQYTTPHGNMAIIWNRAEGYVYDDSIEQDPWVDHWNTNTTITVNSSQSSLTIIDTIGRSNTVPVSGGSASLTVNGAPIIVYGMTAQ